jgi:hypothetical protein
MTWRGSAAAASAPASVACWPRSAAGIRLHRAEPDNDVVMLGLRPRVHDEGAPYIRLHTDVRDRVRVVAAWTIPCMLFTHVVAMLFAVSPSASARGAVPRAGCASWSAQAACAAVAAVATGVVLQ